MKKSPLTLAIYTALFSLPAIAQENENSPSTHSNLETLTVLVSKNNSETLAFGNTHKASDLSISKERLKHRSATLGNALAGEIGVHSNPFGGGASAPVIRGQDGVRVKILQNGTDVIDVSSMSPDHVVAADTLLANKVEIVRGAPTLLYSIASPAGVVNVVDQRIPNKMPEGISKDNLEGETLIRYNANNNEKVITSGITFGIGNHFALRAEGLARKADEYRVPYFQADKVLDYLPGSDNQSKVATVGASYIHDKGYIGAAYSRRKDIYGIPGHIHCGSNKEHFVQWYDTPRYYLPIYPHLMDDDNIYADPHTHCKHDHEAEVGEHNPTGVYVNHEHDAPWILMKTDRYDLQGELQKPIKGLDKVKLRLTYADYYHDERDPGNEQSVQNYKPSERDTQVDKDSISSIFTKKGINGRLEFYHTPTKYTQGLFGIQYQTQKSSAGEVYLPSHFASPEAYLEAQRNNVNQYRPHLLVPNTNKSLSIFALEQFKLGKVTLETAARYERQKTPVHYDEYLLKHSLDSFLKDPARPKVYTPEHPDLSAYKQNALSYAATAFLDINPKNRLSFTYSHNERIPSPMELYYQGRHLATSSFEHGNKNLLKEKSNNYEIGITHTGDKIGYKASGYYSDFANYIFNENIAKEGNLYLRRYNQTTAKFYGLEGQLNYQPNLNHRFTFFGDFVRGKIGALSDVRGKLLGTKKNFLVEDADELRADEDGYAVAQKIFSRGRWIDNPEYQDAVSCSSKTVQEWEAINEDSDCLIKLNVYKNGTTTPSAEDYDTLARPATNAPRVPPARLGFRWQGYLNDRWTANFEFSHVFKQHQVTTSTIAIKPDLRNPVDCKRSDGDCEIKSYINPDNPLVMQPRYVLENKTAGYNLVNLGVDYQGTYQNHDYVVSLYANNLLNEQIYIHNSFLPYVPQMGRNISLSVSTKF